MHFIVSYTSHFIMMHVEQLQPGLQGVGNAGTPGQWLHNFYFGIVILWYT